MKKVTKFHVPGFIEIRRRSLQKSQERLARDAQSNKNRISRIERGQCVPNVIEAVHLARALGVNIEGICVAIYEEHNKEK